MPPAAGVDIILRKAAEILQPRIGQSMVIENRASANMVTGTDACAKAAPDGYTICGLSALSLALNPFTIASLPYDAEKELAPVCEGTVIPTATTVATTSGLATFKDWVEAVKRDPDATNVHALARAVRAGLEQKFGAPKSAKLVWRANTTVPLDEENARALFELIEALDDNDDVQNVYANFEVSDDALAKFAA